MNKLFSCPTGQEFFHSEPVKACLRKQIKAVNINREELIRALQASLAAKKNGAKCIICGAPIWAAGSAVTGTNMCFTCTTGEADDNEDYEVE